MTTNINDFLDRKEIEDAQPSTYPDKINNSNIQIKNINGIYIKNFRTITDQLFQVSTGITLLSGFNGTMKSTVLGLFTQGFNTEFKDLFGKPLKTKYSDIFNLSLKYDGGDKIYHYEYLIEDIYNNKIKIPVTTKVRDKNNPNSDVRILTGGRRKVDGNMNLPTRYVNLNRLLSIHTSNAKVSNIKLSLNEFNRQKSFYNRIFSHKSYNEFEAVTSDDNNKYTFGPSNEVYDYTSISSGEDNLGAIFNALLSFERLDSKSNSIRGILCIDEIEASLHPVAQINLVEYLSKWGRRYNTIVILTTHSLGVIEHITKQKTANHYYFSNLYSKKNSVDIHHNPSYETVKGEMAYQLNSEKDSEVQKINILCEDDVAKFLIKTVIKTRESNKRLEFVETENDNGIGYPQLISFYKKTKKLFDYQSLIFLDGDIKNETMKNHNIDVTDLNCAMTLIPGGENNLCFESWLTLDLLTRENDDPVFKMLNKPASYFRDKFHRVCHGSYDDFLKNPSDRRYSDYCKKFIEETKEVSNSYKIKFIRSQKEFDDFRKLILEKLNIIAKKQGLNEFN